MADIVFAFDAALDRPLPLPAGAPAGVIDAFAAAPWQAFDAAVTTARQARAAALVLFGSTLDPLRASPAQAARLRDALLSLAAEGCRTVWLADDATECANIHRALGEPAGLAFVTPVAPQRLDVRGLSVEICSARGPAVATAGAGPLLPSFASSHSSLLPAQRRVIVGWDDAWTPLHAEGVSVVHGLHAPVPAGGTTAPGTLFVWGSRRLQAVPAAVHALPALQARSPLESGVGACGLATLTTLVPAVPGAPAPPPHAADGRSAWRESPTNRVTWRTLAIESLAGDDRTLADTIHGALEALTPDPAGPLHVVRIAVNCGGSLARRIHVGEISAETLAHLRPLHDVAASRIWCQGLEADRGEALLPLSRNASSVQSGTTASFGSILAEQVIEAEKAGLASASREAAWMALELLESA